MSTMQRDIHALRERWGHLYQVDWIWQERVFRAVPHDGRPALEHREPGTLWNLIADDQARLAAASEAGQDTPGGVSLAPERV